MHIKVKVFPNAKKDAIKEISKDKFECFVKERTQQNAANKKMIGILACYFKLPENKLRIIKGHRGQNKIILIDL